MPSFEPDDSVRISIPDPSDPDHKYHGAVGTVESVTKDDLGRLTGDEADSYDYTVSFDNSALTTMHFRVSDLEEP